MQRATRDGFARRNNRQRRSSTHAGQAKSAGRKRANRKAKAGELAQSARALGISTMELARRRAADIGGLRDSAMRVYDSRLGPEPMPKPKVHSVMVGFRDDDRHWKW